MGATGSIGSSTLDVLGRHPDRYRLYAVTANTSVEAMIGICTQYEPRFAVMADSDSASRLQTALHGVSDTTVYAGIEAMVTLCADPEVDSVMAAIVGFSGLRPALAAARAGKRLLLANKEALVAAGAVFMRAVRDGGAALLPIDSEHNAMFQCLPADPLARTNVQSVEKILLTASGGPFRGWSREQLTSVTPDQACAHPNWSMGRKISVDSATLMNKGLELAEACWLFDRSPEQIEVVVHPQSVIHSLIRYRDGSVLAQLGNPDMRTPIAYGLSWPDRIDAGVQSLDLVSVGQLDFEAPDTSAFPCLRLAQEAIKVPGGMCVLNAANEVAVSSFLEGGIRFTDIDRVIEVCLEAITADEPDSLDAVEVLNGRARDAASDVVGEMLARTDRRAAGR
ncbi:1-deoxy-D-xylulose 5-phosphate reductoisomerase [Luminiphilus syltensis NOR5-1B]|uniref:1-deoxy-D-xylulose 5-phosphate reductoisomerase n=1 Tax=Luminiphilus syltensis NOR5-1B TaxID=565045 RepID=B8KY95_9GAMM|nr:1-deoxy-D-xylulose 5-phosphate reductoisomerase [Luminiphilus syltensis NOR5-1B]